MRKNFKLPFLAMLALLASACTNDDVMPQGSDYLTDKPVMITVGSVQTRAGYAANEVIESGSLGLWLNQGDAKYDAANLEVKYESGVWTPLGKLLWKNATDEATYTATYPYDADGVYEVSVPAVQTNETAKAAEVLYATGTAKGGNGAINITFAHALAQVKVALTKASNLGTVTVNSVTLSSAATSGTFTATTGAWSNPGNSQEVSFIKNSDTEFEALLVPQTLTGYSIEIAATVDGTDKVYSYTATEAVILNQGETYTIPVQVGETICVDLGLPSGTLWATCNVGATAPQEYGDYFAWGETSPKSNYDWPTYKYGSSYNTLTKYCSNSLWGKDGLTDGLTTLEACDDAATYNLGSNWRTPTEAEFNELLYQCDWTWTTDYNGTGVVGYIVKSRAADNINTIFLPVAGYYSENNVVNEKTAGYYWSNSLTIIGVNNAKLFQIEQSDKKIGNDHRCLGLSIRPVYVKP